MLWQVIFSIRKQRNISMNIINSIKTMCIRVCDNYIPYFSKSCKRCNRLNRCGERVYNWKSRKKRKEQCWMRIYFTFVAKKIIHSSFVLLWQIILTVPLSNLVPFALSITTENSRKYFLFSYREIVWTISNANCFMNEASVPVDEREFASRGVRRGWSRVTRGSRSEGRSGSEPCLEDSVDDKNEGVSRHSASFVRPMLFQHVDQDFLGGLCFIIRGDMFCVNVVGG